MWGCSKVKAVGVGRNGTTLPGGVSGKGGDSHRLSVSEAGDKDRWQSPEPGFDSGETPWCVLGGGKTELCGENLRLIAFSVHWRFLISFPKCGSWYTGTALRLFNKQLHSTYCVSGTLFLNKYIIMANKTVSHL